MTHSDAISLLDEWHKVQKKSFCASYLMGIYHDLSNGLSISVSHDRAVTHVIKEVDVTRGIPCDSHIDTWLSPGLVRCHT